VVPVFLPLAAHRTFFLSFYAFLGLFFSRDTGRSNRMNASRIRYGAMNFPVKPILSEIDAIAALGFDYLELAMDPPQAHHTQIRQSRKEIRDKLAHHGLGLVCHLPTFVHTADLTDSIRKASLGEMLASLEAAAELSPEKVVAHPGHIGGLGAFVLDHAMALAMESLSTIVEKAQQLHLLLCVENMFPKHPPFVEPESFNDLFNRFSDLRLTLDIGHAAIDSQKSRRALDFIHRWAPRIGHIHVSDNCGKRDDHLALGEGSIDFRKIAAALEKIGYGDTITLEVFSEDRQRLRQSREKLAGCFCEK
jgi:sugar phosphate isomerase/epimerase